MIAKMLDTVVPSFHQYPRLGTSADADRVGPRLQHAAAAGSRDYACTELFEAYGHSLPSEEVGGDLVDLIPTEAGWIACLADVSGHGIQPAF